MITAFALLGLVPTIEPSIQDFVQAKLKDTTFTTQAVTANQRELAKINKDFANSYRFKTVLVRIKEPFRMRLESTVDDTEIYFVINGPIRTIRIPRAGFSQKLDLAKKPGQRQTVLEFGLITPALFDGTLFYADFVREDRATGLPVFDVFYAKNLDDTTRQRIWVDPQKKIVTRREWYSQIDNRLMAVFTYEDPQQVDGVWFPTRAVVRNADNKVAGVTRYTNIKVNTGLPDSLFVVK
jgi:outer membrane lipoprotein-sorting protein